MHWKLNDFRILRLGFVGFRRRTRLHILVRSRPGIEQSGFVSTSISDPEWRFELSNPRHGDSYVRSFPDPASDRLGFTPVFVSPDFHLPLV